MIKTAIVCIKRILSGINNTHDLGVFQTQYPTPAIYNKWEITQSKNPTDRPVCNCVHWMAERLSKLFFANPFAPDNLKNNPLEVIIPRFIPTP